MPSNPQGQSSPKKLPFEPKSAKSAQKKAPKPSNSARFSPNPPRRAPQSGTIPEVVSRRMAKRMVVFCGIPTLLGLATLPLSYWIIAQDLMDLPNVAVILVSLLFLGLSVLGLSYGVLSASWDEDQPGSWLGISEFQLNWQRLLTSWQERRQP
ncbi:PAM68 family protein [Lyngbya confervoides]|uniref:PAM68 family protein n=1 Tax=Lyngbya confervoides BDU141951 TaxID=1574623 RepID=A0ABD4T802_9CYAN|nr:PAM68 family protein [Lyngbya confervoides]MCM1984858.1 PAM68 family protein [Lyngbya confervoides BDU141951]